MLMSERTLASLSCSEQAKLAAPDYVYLNEALATCCSSARTPPASVCSMVPRDTLYRLLGPTEDHISLHGICDKVLISQGP